MRTNNRHIIYLLTILFFLSACEKKREWTINPLEESIIAIDAMITNERKAHEVRIMEVTNDGRNIPVTGASVWIQTPNKTNADILIESIDSLGTYLTDTNFIANDTGFYELHISYNGYEYNAEAKSTTIGNLTRFNYSLDSDSLLVGDSLYYITSINEVYQSEEAMYQITMDWSMVKGYEDLEDKNNHAFVKSYSLNTLDVNEIFPSNKARFWFPAGTQVVERKYSLTEEHSEFIRALLSETEWRGYLFDVSAGNLPTNFDDGAIGYFSVCRVKQVTFTVNP